MTESSNNEDAAMLWTLAEMVNATGGTLTHAPSGTIGVNGISIDTRTLSHGEAYFAIKGDVHDGHAFVANAHRAGAAVSVIAADKRADLGDDTGPLLVVPDVLVALEALGRAARTRCGGKIIAITGSVGKTSTKEALRVALSACGAVHASVASFNNHWGVPLTLARMPRDTEFGIFEIGMNHPNEITPLVQMVRPHVAMINNVAPVHLGAFDSVDGIAHAKAEIFDGLNLDGSSEGHGDGAQGGVALLNADDPRFDMLSQIARGKGVERIVSFGEAATADVRGEKIVEHADCSCLTVRVFDDRVMAKVGSPGRHIAKNALAVLAIVSLVGADLAKAALALAHLAPVKGRGERHVLSVEGGDATLIDESYNANPASMRAMFSMLAGVQPEGRGRRMVALGDMLELGPTSKDLHAQLAEPLLAAGFEVVFLAGPDMAALRDALDGRVVVHHADDVDGLIDPVVATLRAGDVLAAKASLGLKFAKLIDGLKDRFSNPASLP
ncbi:MAG: UDP-N-acetylmuramoylalanyl-D-glutamyl-2,6-diaminopimelate--D-alanyl-D-alanine ligase [Pseudomonadota bacterium]